MTDEQSLINEALENFLESALSKEVIQKISNHYGTAIALKVKAVYVDALNCPVDWQTETIDTALPVLHDLLNSKYPWLSKKARSKIKDAFITAWK